MPELRVLTSPGDAYLRAVSEAIEAAERVTLVMAFASPAGVKLIAPSLERLLSRFGTTARLVLGIDRQGFNTVAVFRALLDLEARYGSRLELGVVAEQTGILHAKLVLAEGAGTSELFIGSANLTRSALRTNHEATLHVRDVPSDVRSALSAFLRSLHPAPLNGASADAILGPLGGIVSPPSPRAPASTSAAWGQLMAALQTTALLPLAQEPREFVSGWIARGYLVGRGRRTTDAFTIRLPLDALAELHLIKVARRRSIGNGARESRTLGYSIDLLPPPVASEVRRVARRVVALPMRLGLALPCFGLWMPDSYWSVFEEARACLFKVSALNQGTLLAAAQEQRAYLVDAGGITKELDSIVGRLRADAGLSSENEAAARRELEEHLVDQLRHRTPEVLGQAIEFRTARQQWAPFEKTEAPYRQLLVDIVQACFSSTYRTGRWPRQIRSYAAREVVHHVEKTLRAANVPIEGLAAVDLLSFAETWENPVRSFDDVVSQFRRFIPDDIEFTPPAVDDLIAEAGAEQGEDDDDA